MRRIRLTESDITRIVRRVIKENKEDIYSDLYGKTVRYKDESQGIEIQGIIKKITEYGYGIKIEHSSLKQINNVTWETGEDIWTEVDIDDNYSVYDCEDKKFAFNLIMKNFKHSDIYYRKAGRGKIQFNTFTCKSLSDVLSKRYPCTTDFSMNKESLPSNFA